MRYRDRRFDPAIGTRLGPHGVNLSTTQWFQLEGVLTACGGKELPKVGVQGIYLVHIPAEPALSRAVVATLIDRIGVSDGEEMRRALYETRFVVEP